MVLWGTSTIEKTSAWATLAAVGERLVFTTDERVFAITQEGQGEEQESLEAPASEMRVWEVPGRRGQWIGLCLPTTNQVWLAISIRGEWPRFVNQWLGENEIGGTEPGRFLSPLSLDAGPDGRVYVLDAGNARVQVFDADGQYITQWESSTLAGATGRRTRPRTSTAASPWTKRGTSTSSTPSTGASRSSGREGEKAGAVISAGSVGIGFYFFLMYFYNMGVVLPIVPQQFYDHSKR